MANPYDPRGKLPGTAAKSSDPTRGYSKPPRKYYASYARRLSAARRSLLAIRNFGHNEPSAVEVADRFGIDVKDAKRILLEIFGDAILDRAKRPLPDVTLYGRRIPLGRIGQVGIPSLIFP